jgi:hypothetical protein
MPTDQPDAEGGADLAGLLRRRRERLGHGGEEGISTIAGVAGVTPERWRELEQARGTPSPEELPRIALALVDISESGPGDDPAEVLAELRARLPAR